MKQDTIAAIATPLGSGAVAIVRLSGEDALQIADTCFQATNGSLLQQRNGYTGCLGRVILDGREVDEVIAFVYKSPKSYTGEDIVELCCHGGTFLVRQVLEACIRCGARPAQPGEFTKRAFLNGKMNLSQAEAVCDLINAHSEGARRAALSARDGALSTEIHSLVENLTAQSAHLAAWADYPEEDLEPVDATALRSSLEELLQRMNRLLSTYRRGTMLREGIRTAIVGKPNVGKSSLMNLLSGTDRSIVTDIPGTTRDIVQEQVYVGDFILSLLDTAGIRETKDSIEQKGVLLAKEQISSAQLVLAVFDMSCPLTQEDRAVLQLLDNANTIAVVNKTDLTAQLDVQEIQHLLDRVVLVSANTGDGKQELEQEILTLLQLDSLDTTAAILSNERQYHAVLRSRQSLAEAVDALECAMTLDAVNVCIDDALEQLLSITGEKATDKIVEQVFANFCVGK